MRRSQAPFGDLASLQAEIDVLRADLQEATMNVLQTVQTAAYAKRTDAPQPDMPPLPTR